MRLIDADALIEHTRAHGQKIAYVESFIQDIKEAPTVGGWISVKDRLPEEAGEYIVSDGETAFGAYYEINAYGRRWTDATEGYYEFRVTHWMPMPELPKGGDGDEPD